MSVWCSGRGGFAWGRGHGFEPRQPRSVATCDLMTGTGGWLANGLSPIKKVNTTTIAHHGTNNTHVNTIAHHVRRPGPLVLSWARSAAHGTAWDTRFTLRVCCEPVAAQGNTTWSRVFCWFAVRTMAHNKQAKKIFFALQKFSTLKPHLHKLHIQIWGNYNLVWYI
jgi:hypothetical protein